MVTITQMQYVVAVDTYRHFVTASEKCFVTQPTLSMQIKKMEETLDVVIFDRSKQPIIPTEIGATIIEQRRVVLAGHAQLFEIVNAEKNLVEGELNIGIIPSLAPYLLPLFVGGMREKFPHVRLKATELLTDDIIHQLKKDQIDVGILVTPLNDSAIDEKPLFYEKMLLYVNRDHAFASKKVVKADEIATPDLWLLSKGHCFRSQTLNLCSYQAKTNNEHLFEYESGSLETLKRLVASEGGFTVVPELAIDDVNNVNTVIKAFDATEPLREVSIVYARTFSKKSMIDALSSEIKNAVPKEMLNANRGNVVEWR